MNPRAGKSSLPSTRNSSPSYHARINRSSAGQFQQKRHFHQHLCGCRAQNGERSAWPRVHPLPHQYQSRIDGTRDNQVTLGCPGQPGIVPVELQMQRTLLRELSHRDAYQTRCIDGGLGSAKLPTLLDHTHSSHKGPPAVILQVQVQFV